MQWDRGLMLPLMQQNVWAAVVARGMHKPTCQWDAGPRKVYLRWLLDSKKFNEWMNPIDYETEEYQAEQEALDQSAASRGRQLDGVDALGSKRKFSPGGEAGARRAAPRQRTDPGPLLTTCCFCSRDMDNSQQCYS